MNFNARYSKYVNELPPYVLKRIQNAIEKKFLLNDTNIYIDDIFAKYYAQYQKKKAYDGEYFGKNNQKLSELEKENALLKKLVYKLKTQQL